MTGSSDVTEPFESNDAPVMILIPGAELSKSVDRAMANLGETLTYVVTYTNPTPPIPGTPRLNLEVDGKTFGNTSFSHDFRITNHSAGIASPADGVLALGGEAPGDQSAAGAGDSRGAR